MKSGNLATDLLLEHVGTAEVAAVLRDAGCSPATVAAPRASRTPPPATAGLDNLVTAADLARVIGAVAPDAGAARDVRGRRDVLAAQEHRDQVPAGLPAGTYVAHKTGWVPGVAHDVALVRPDGLPPYVLASATRRTRSRGDALRAQRRRQRRGLGEVDRVSRIESVTTTRLTTPLHTPFVTALRRTTTTDTVVVRVVDSDGVTGWGEAPQVWQVTGESLAGAQACVDGPLAAVVAGRDPDDLADLCRAVGRGGRRQPRRQGGRRRRPARPGRAPPRASACRCCSAAPRCGCPPT